MNKVEVTGKIATVNISQTAKGKAAHVYIESDGVYFQVTYWDEKADKAQRELKAGLDVEVKGELSIKPYTTRDGKSSVSVNINKPALKIKKTAVTATEPQAEQRQEPVVMPDYDKPIPTQQQDPVVMPSYDRPVAHHATYTDKYGNSYYIDDCGGNHYVNDEGEEIIPDHTEDDDALW